MNWDDFADSEQLLAKEVGQVSNRAGKHITGKLSSQAAVPIKEASKD